MLKENDRVCLLPHPTPDLVALAGEHGTVRGHLNNLYEVAMDSGDIIFVSEKYLERLSD